MSRHLVRPWGISVCVLVLSSLSWAGDEADGPLPDGHPPAADEEPAEPSAHDLLPGMGPSVNQGVVRETMDSGGYTYVHLATCDKQYWAAAPITPVNVGEVVQLPSGVPMTHFTSSTLDKTFDYIEFVSRVEPATSDLPCLEELVGEISATIEADVTAPVGKVDEELTIEQIIVGKEDYSGMQVSFRGEVTKFNPNIMGTNWFHLQDGSGSEKDQTHDLTITTSDTVEVGAKIVVTGLVSTNRDFGAGYNYAIIIENATVAAQ